LEQKEMKKNKILITIYYVVLAFIFSILLSILGELVFKSSKKIFDMFTGNLVSTIISGILCILIVVFGVMKRYLPKRNININNKYYWIQFVPGSMFLLVSFILIFANTIRLIDLGLGPFNFIIDFANNLTLTDFTIFDFCLLSPIIEEFIYRVFVFKKLQTIYIGKMRVIVSALIFGFIHLNYSQGIKALLIGLILGWIYYYTHSFFLVAFLHILNNTYFVVSNLYPSMIYTIKEGFNIAELLIGILIGIIAILLIRAFVKNNPVRYEEDVIEEQMKLQSNEAVVD
jgi:membrane protease YdiL (CAAX protease family)